MRNDALKQLEHITTEAEYEAAMARIRALQRALFQAGSDSSGWSPKALALSEEIDRYVVLVQRYWDAFDATADAALRPAKAAW